MREDASKEATANYQLLITPLADAPASPRNTPHPCNQYALKKPPASQSPSARSSPRAASSNPPAPAATSHHDPFSVSPAPEHPSDRPTPATPPQILAAES